MELQRNYGDASISELAGQEDITDVRWTMLLPSLSGRHEHMKRQQAGTCSEINSQTCDDLMEVDDTRRRLQSGTSNLVQPALLGLLLLC